MLDIIHRDSRTIAVNKPAGMLVHRSWLDKHETRFAVQTLRDQIGQHVYPVHRLDRPTSGVLLFALDTEAARLLTQQFENKTIEKTYWAIVRGHLPSDGLIDYALKYVPDKIAEAQTEATLQEALSGANRVAVPIRAALSDLALFVGRTHALHRPQTPTPSPYETHLPPDCRRHQLRRFAPKPCRCRTYRHATPDVARAKPQFSKHRRR